MTSQKLTLPQTMKAQFIESFKTAYVLRTVPLPKPSSPYDLLIKVDAASYCHTDAVLAEGLMPPNPPSFPHIGCHEFAGTIISVPRSDSSDMTFKVGDRIGVPGRAFNPCGSCFECLDEKSPDSDPAGYSVFCPNSGNNGLSRAGGFAEYAVVDARQVAPIPSSMTAVETAPLMCAGVTIYSALKRCELLLGQRIGIVGCGGGLGHLGLQFASKMGFKVIGLDSADGALKLARDLDTGAKIVDVRTEQAENIVQEVGKEDEKKESGDMGLDAVIILPESQKAFEYGIQLLKNHGKCVVVSFPETGFHFSARDVVFRDISIVGSLVGSNKTLRETLEFAAEHRVRAVVKTFPLSRLNDLVTEYHNGSGGKLVIDMSLET
ncbi:hypothetical protein IFR05_000845 [Cadophora sp. M221]|nr:hypothetical protein IFR05_000845 [Cadophora sp. M221]